MSNNSYGLAAQVKVVLVRPSHPGNIGASARAMKTMGLTRLSLVEPKEFPSTTAIARAAGADDILQQAECYNTLQQALADCHWAYAASARQRALAWTVDTPAAAAQRIIQWVDPIAGSPERQSLPRQIAIVFGAEQSGLTNEELACCHAQIVIPSPSSYSSLNLAAAVQVIVYELYMAQYNRSMVPGSDSNHFYGEDAWADDEPVTMVQLQGLYDHLASQMKQVGFLERRSSTLLMRRLRRFFQRVPMGQKELNILRGFLTALDKHQQKQHD